MSFIFPDFIRAQVAASQTVFDGSTLRVALFHRAPLFSTNDGRYTSIKTVADLKAKLGWEEVVADGYPIDNSRAVVSRVQGNSRYVVMPGIALDDDLEAVEVRAAAFYYQGSLGGTTNPVVLITNTPFAPSVTLRGGDTISAVPDSTLGSSNNRWVFGWGVSNPANSMVEGPLAIQKTAPEYESPHTQHVWLYPQRVNFIANPSFEGGVNHWRTNGTAIRVDASDAQGVKAGQFDGASPIVAESNFFPTLKPHFTIQMLVSGTGQVRVGLVTWPVEYNETVVDWGDDSEIWDLSPNSFIHVQVLRSAAQPYEGQLRVESSGDLLILNNVLLENEYLLDWPYFDGESRYSARDDFTWYGGENLKGKTYSLWYNNKRSTAGRLFATAMPDQAKATSEEVLKEGLVYQWIPAGVLVEPHWDVLYPEDLQHPVVDVAGSAVTPYKTAPIGTPEWAADMGVTRPFPEEET